VGVGEGCGCGRAGGMGCCICFALLCFTSGGGMEVCMSLGVGFCLTWFPL
jgi:hypothetical protein